MIRATRSPPQDKAIDPPRPESASLGRSATPSVDAPIALFFARAALHATAASSCQGVPDENIRSTRPRISPAITRCVLKSGRSSCRGRRDPRT